MDKSHIQAQETRKRNAEVRVALAAEQKRDKALVLDALRAVLQDPEATTAQRLYAVAVLDNMTYGRFVPYELKRLGSAEAAAAFARELEGE